MTHKIAWLGVGAVAVINGVKVRAVESDSPCEVCVFLNDHLRDGCNVENVPPCQADYRPDGKSIIYQRVESEEEL